MQSIEGEDLMSTTHFADAGTAGRVLASRESDGMAHHDWRELAARENDGLEVSLLWSKSADRVKVAVADAKLDEEFEFDVAGADALAAFYHPFAYAAARGLCFGEAARDSLDLQPLS
jgi:hypothetical protein